MSIYLHKILPLLISPIFLILFFISLYIYAKKRSFILIALVIFLLSSNSIIANKLNFFLEQGSFDRENQIPDQFKNVVVLSGFLKSSIINDQIFTEWNDPDRFNAGIEIFKKNELDNIIFTRGYLPWSNSVPEGEYLKNYAISLGIDNNKILLSDLSGNTEEEANSIKKILKDNLNIILITSAYHMPRAKYIFEKNGFFVHPFPVDFNYSLTDITPMHFIPNSSALDSTSKSIRELLGRFFYLIKYKILI